MRRLRLLVLTSVLLGLLVHGAVLGAGTVAVFHADKPLEVGGEKKWQLPRFSVDSNEEHIYGISYEVQGASGAVVAPQTYQTFRADGSLIQNVWIRNEYGTFRLHVDDTWQTGRVEVFTKRGSASLVLGMWPTGGKNVRVRNVRLVEGGFPEAPPLAGAPYLKWINSLKPNADFAGGNPLLKFDDKGAGIWAYWTRDIRVPDNEVKSLQEEVRSYMEVAVERLIQLMPKRRPNYFHHTYYPRRAAYLWDPREPDVLRNKDGTVFDVAARYPVTGYEEVVAPSGKVAKYPYHDPPGTKVQPSVASVKGDIAFPKEWRLFGPLSRDDPVLPAEVLARLPAEIAIAGRTLKCRTAVVPGGRFDLGNMYDGVQEGKTAYAFAVIESDKAADITVGAGADYWMQWWLNGKEVYSNIPRGNVAHPPTLKDHLFAVHLNRGPNVLAVRAISGTGSFVLHAGGPRELRKALRGFLPKPPKGRVYLDHFMTTVRVAEMYRASHTMAALYRKTGNEDCALRSAAILWALARAIPDWPIFGINGGDRVGQFWPPDTYEHWMAFIFGGWYTDSMWMAAWPSRTYDLLRDAPVWNRLDELTGRKTRQDVENTLLYVAKMALKYDAFRRTNPWQFYHNTCGGELRAYIEIGRAVGCPELVHYALNKSAGMFRYTFMADGMYPESTSYMAQVMGGLANIAGSANGYADPPGYVAKVDGRHIESVDLTKDIPLYGRACEVIRRLRFPDGTPATIHDTNSNTVYPSKAYARAVVHPFLLPEFGHGILGRGKKPDRVEAHLHFSGCYTHAHWDMLTFTLWAYGDELTADIGYTTDVQGHYNVDTTSHNLMVVDGKNQKGYGIHRGNLTAWYPLPDAAQAAQASGPAVYDGLKQYRRAIVLVPFAPGKDAVVDVFEVRGGSRHEWMANGCADYAQKVETNLVTARKLDNLAEDGKAVTDGSKHTTQGGPVEPGKKSVFYGAFRNVRICNNTTPWHVTMTAKPPVPEGTPGAGPRATSKDAKPGLRLHWLGPLDGQAMLCESPRNRYSRPHEHPEEAKAAWSMNLMPKIIVRRDGKDLASTLVAAWEPFHNRPWMTKVVRLPDVPERDGVGIMLRAAEDKAIVLYRRPESSAMVKGGGIATNGRFAILREGSGESALDLYDGTQVTAGAISATLSRAAAMPVLSLQENNGQHTLIAKGAPAAYPTNAAKQPHAGRFVRFDQEGQSSRWLPLARIERGSPGECRLVLARDPGFVFDVPRKFLRETCFPHRSLRGVATVILPTWLNVKWRTVPGGARLKVRASGDVRLRLAGLGNVKKARARSEASKPWIEVPVTIADGKVTLQLSPRTLGKGWWEIELGAAIAQ